MLASRLARYSSKSLFGILVRLPLRAIPKSAVVRVRSGINKGSRWIVGSSVHGCWLGHYELEKQAAVRRLVKPGLNVLDIGANAGFYSLAFSRLVGTTGHVWAFEPLPENIGNLRRHIELNALKNVTVVEAAVSGKSGYAQFDQAPSNAMGRLSGQGRITVRTVTLDEVCAQTGRPDLIKLDVEGGESAALEGAYQTLSHHRPVILLATHGPEQERRCVELLKAIGYQFSYLDGAPAASGTLTSDELIAASGRGA